MKNLFIASFFLTSTNVFASKMVVIKTIRAVNKESVVEVYSGSTIGNNTAGTVLGFFDVKNNEIAVFANTNCVSDN